MEPCGMSCFHLRLTAVFVEFRALWANVTDLGRYFAL